jgi:transposase
VSKVSVLSGPERRRRWTTVEKLRIVEASHAPSASVIEVARRHDVHPNLLTVWRRQARTGAIGPAAALRQEDAKKRLALRSVCVESMGEKDANAKDYKKCCNHFNKHGQV